MLVLRVEQAELGGRIAPCLVQPIPDLRLDDVTALQARPRMTKRIYLAGPAVFLANARDIGARKRAICERHGLVGVFPGDEEDPCDPTLPPAEQGLAISRAMERVMRGCDAMIVNLTPFRGPSADVGSAYETGFMRALDRPIFAYSNDGRSFPDRIASFCGAVRTRTTGEHEDADGMAIEPFMRASPRPPRGGRTPLRAEALPASGWSR
jgi:nucleoside 2-deoxyribosyltransferase